MKLFKCRFLKKLLGLGILLFGVTLLQSCVGVLNADESKEYHMIEIDGPIHPPVQEYLDRTLQRAEEKNVQGFIIRLDTPGGLMDSMNKMTKRMLNTDVPTIVWVGPGGARAASAGVFITYASHVAVMAKTTNMGAAAPVSGGGGKMSETKREKVVNDAVAKLKSIAEKRGRNADLVDNFIRESESYTGSEAEKKGAVDFLADSRNELLRKLDGYKVRMDGNMITLNKGEVREVSMSWRERFFSLLLNPSFLYLMMLLGIYGFIIEFSNPGLGLGLVMGCICLLLSMYGMGVLPVNFVGLALIVVGLGLMVIDVFVPTFGVLTIGGVVAFVFGSMALFDHGGFQVPLGLVLSFSVTSVLIVAGLGYLIVKAHLQASEMGEGSLIGDIGEVRTVLDPVGMVHINGEYWTAEAYSSETIEEGSKVCVVEEDGENLIVEQENPSNGRPDA